jgi:hypothetical protein
MNRDEALKKVESVCNLKTRVITATPKTRLVLEPDIIWLKPGNGGHQLEVTDRGIEQLSAFAHIPDSYRKDLTPNTYASLTGELLQKKGSFTIIMQNGRVTGFAKAEEYRYIDPEKVMKALERLIPGADFDRVIPYDDKFAVMVDVVTERRQEVVVGDPASAGATILFSPINIVIPSVTSYVKRWFCLNGASSFEKLAEFKGGGDGGFLPWFNSSVKKAYRGVDRILNQWRDMTLQTITPADRAGLLAALLKEARISGDVAQAIEEHALEEPPQTAYDLYNLITWGASHVLTDPIAILHARKAADGFSREKTHRRLCPVCRSRSQVALPPPQVSAG